MEQSQTEAAKVTKFQEKRARIYEERKRRLLNNGVPEDKVDEVLAREDYAKIPLEKKFETFVNHTIQNVATLYENNKNLAKDIGVLRNNQIALSQAQDVNVRTIISLLKTLGVTKEAFDTAFNKVVEEYDAELRKADEEAKKKVEELRKASEEAAQKDVTLKDVETEKDKVSENQETTYPEGAVIHGESNV